MQESDSGDGPPYLGEYGGKQGGHYRAYGWWKSSKIDQRIRTLDRFEKYKSSFYSELLQSVTVC